MAITAITPPIFIRGEDLLIYESVADAELDLEPVDIKPEWRGYDADGRALDVRVRGKVRTWWITIDQSGASVEVVLAEEAPTHAEELRAELVSWLTDVEGAAPTGPLAELVQRARRYAEKLGR